MKRYIWRRLLSAAFVAVGVTVATFVLLHLEPGDPARRSRDELVDEVRITVVHEIAHHFGIDDDRLHELGYG